MQQSLYDQGYRKEVGISWHAHTWWPEGLWYQLVSKKAIVDSQELQYLNLAINNITRIENLHRCESLAKLDLTMNFVDRPALTSIANLQPLIFLRELHLLGNPCTNWGSYQAYVIAMLPQLQILVSYFPSP